MSVVVVSITISIPKIKLSNVNVILLLDIDFVSLILEEVIGHDLFFVVGCVIFET